jgi:NADPH-dependent glutamate synthase beta subunit-like oxidoreductase/formate hydrogenlyase subunit 6/NADH:ubiquinone oxidoreductase subunit I
MKKQFPPGAARKAILLVGSGYGALKVAQDLAQSGLPLIWVTKAPHFLELPNSRESFTEWPADLNFQFRPLYLRVTRHPLVTALTHAHVESIEKGPEGYRVVTVQDPPYVDYDLCTGCGRCMSVCPLQETSHPPLRRTPPYCPSRALDLDKRKPAPCRGACPLGINVQAYMALTAASRFDEALAVIREDNPLPGICGRVCHHPCEEACRRLTVDEAVSICSVKRYLADRELTIKPPGFTTADKKKRPQRVAVIGAGPAGLTAAHFLNQAGFGVTIFEANKEAGGMLRMGINAFRLPRDILNLEIQAITAAGVEIRTGTPVADLRQLFTDGFRAVLLCTGAHRDLLLGIKGEDSRGVSGAVKMLSSIHSGRHMDISGQVVVIGGGNSAIDAARAAVRLGAASVTICYRRERGDMPARKAEIREAEEEGIVFEFRVAPVRIAAKNGKASGLELIRMKMGSPDESGRRRPLPLKGSEFKIPADRIIVAIGQEPHWRDMGAENRPGADKSGRVLIDQSYSTDQPGVFAAGDVVTGPATVVGSMAQGRQAAARIITYLRGTADKRGDQTEASFINNADYVEIPADEPLLARHEMERRDPLQRRLDFGEVETGFTAVQAVSEAQRCLQCASCCECRACESACLDVGAIDHARAPRRTTIIAPSIIIANEEEITQKGLSKGKGVYRVGDFRHTTDIVNVLMAGSASAGLAMAEGSSLRVTGQPSAPEISTVGSEDRLGIFVCTCNGTMASAAALKRINDLGRKLPGVVHSELVFSACHPRGAEMIAKAVRTQKLGRVIMASCVCCPLEFQCISCNDQRNRARIHLFDRLGLDRSRFEMVNLRDHLDAAQNSDDQVVAKARDFLRESFIRARFLGPLRSGTTKIGKNILILGGSEVGLSCARILDMQGFNVRLVHRCRLKGKKEIPREIRMRPAGETTGGNIKYVQEAIIDSIRGHLGDFQVALEENGHKRLWRADIVCLTDLNMLTLAIPEDMFGLKKFYRYDFAFFHTPQIGIYRVMPRTLARVTPFQAGSALAAQVATAAAEAFLKDHELSPRVDPRRCRGCGRCADICPFDAVRMVANDRGFYTAEILRHNCVGCGGCVGRCPVTAMDMPYFSNRLLEEIVACTLTET